MSESNHSVEWLSENGDIMIPVVDHETTTMIKVGHVDSGLDTTPRVLWTSTTETSPSESPIEHENEPIQNVEDDSSKVVEWTTEKPAEEVTEHHIEENINNVLLAAETTTTTAEIIPARHCS